MKYDEHSWIGHARTLSGRLHDNCKNLPIFLSGIHILWKYPHSMEISTFHVYYLHFVDVYAFHVYYPFFVDISTFRGYYLNFVDIYGFRG